jgi:hypothetical protein
MEPTALRADASLHEVLSDRARRATPGRLGLDLAGGGLVAATALWARPVAWGIVASAAACLFFYGAWAMAERRLHPEVPPAVASRELPWFVVRTVAAILGLCAFTVFVLAALRTALGTIIS